MNEVYVLIVGGWLEEYGSDFIIIGGCVLWRIGLMKFGEYYFGIMKWKFENEGNFFFFFNLLKVENKFYKEF